MASTTGTAASRPPPREDAVPLSAVEFCVVDLETTGSTLEDKITEIGAVRVRGGEVTGEFQTLVDPQTHVPGLISVLTGITDAAVAGAPTIGQVLPGYLEFQRGCVVVAHNARFDVGFLRRACAAHEYAWPRPMVVDTVALARCILLPEEVRDHRLATLADHFHSTTVPIHRALDDARATVDVLHGLIERVGTLGVRTLTDLYEFTRKVSPQRRAKRSWAKGLPDLPGVYWFVIEPDPATAAIGHLDEPDELIAEADDDDPAEILYVGKSVSLRARVRTYFTADERRRRMEEMIRIATGLRHRVCATPLHAEVTELRMIAAHEPRYNRRSRRPDEQYWVKLTDEPVPRLAVTRRVAADRATYFGPVRRRSAAVDIIAAVHDAFPIRQCTERLPALHVAPRLPIEFVAEDGHGCMLADLGRCCAPCRPEDHDGSDPYPALVAGVRHALTDDIRPLLTGVRDRMTKLVARGRFEEAGQLKDRVDQTLAAARRLHRVSSIARCPEIVAAAPRADGWDVHVIRWGKLARAARAAPGEVPQAVARDAVRDADHVEVPVLPMPAGLFEETERIADWLEHARIISCDGDWFWPVHALIDVSDLPAAVLAPSEPKAG